jgi:hypothetical protein
LEFAAALAVACAAAIPLLQVAVELAHAWALHHYLLQLQQQQQQQEEVAAASLLHPFLQLLLLSPYASAA